MDSILNTIKKLLGIDSNYTAFDVDILVFINSTFMALTQLGVGPTTGFSISSATTTWNNYLPDGSLLEGVKAYMAQKVRMQFDPPTTSYLLDALNRTLTELEWRISVLVPIAEVAGEETDE
jgi:hypothetical protein